MRLENAGEDLDVFFVTSSLHQSQELAADPRKLPILPAQRLKEGFAGL
jgi:hypothetical protein